MHKVILLLVILISSSASAQKVRSYFTEDHQRTDSIHAYYYKSGKMKRGFYIDTVLAYYADSDKIMSRTVHDASGRLSGFHSTYYRNGRLKSKGTYYADIPMGYFLYWYDNGKPHKTIQFEEGRWPSPFDHKLINYWDRNGTQLVTNGSGFCRCYFESDTLQEFGKIVKGERDSVWVAVANNQKVLEEIYDHGTFRRGTRYQSDKEIHYSGYQTGADFKGGQSAMARYLMDNVRYPDTERRAGREGIVIWSFLVNTDGTIADIKLENGVSELLDKEALRVLKRPKKWTPATYRGKLITQRVVFPVRFKLQS